jgi:Carboxypeptidase regulatory-like domain
MRRNDDRKGGPRWRRPAWAVAAALAALLQGCGDDNKAPNLGSYYPVTGKVTLPDGKPLAATNVIFSGPVTSTATTQSDGTFTFKGDKDGLPAGDYKIKLEVVESKGTAKHPILPFPPKYLDEDGSDLTATVKPVESNSFDLKLTPGNDAAGKSADDRRKSR